MYDSSIGIINLYPANAAPDATVSVGSPNAKTGVVTGTVTASDPNGTAAQSAKGVGVWVVAGNVVDCHPTRRGEAPTEVEVAAEGGQGEDRVVRPDVVDGATCDRVAEALDGIALSGAGTRRLLDTAWCRALVGRVRAVLVGAELLACDAVAVQCTYFDKSPQNNWRVAYHQDQSIPVRERVQAAGCSGWTWKEGDLFVQPPIDVLRALLAVRLHVDRCTDGNGPLRVLAGTHDAGRCTAERIQELRARVPEAVCHVLRGGVLLMRPLLLHASSKAISEGPRRVLHFVFGPPTLPLGLRWARAI